MAVRLDPVRNASRRCLPAPRLGQAMLQPEERRIPMATEHAARVETVPISNGRLLDFARDPRVCMQRLYREHGLIAALEDEGNRLYFVFGPEYNRRLLSDTETFHARFFALRGPRNSAQRR